MTLACGYTRPYLALNTARVPANVEMPAHLLTASLSVGSTHLDIVHHCAEMDLPVPVLCVSLLIKSISYVIHRLRWIVLPVRLP